ncbi:MAG: hypothetical protein AAGJ18_11450 [Bacteroidota bacterium]
MKKLMLLIFFCGSCQFLSAQMMMNAPTDHLQQRYHFVRQAPKATNFSEQIHHPTLFDAKQNGSLLTNQQQVPLVYAYKDLAFFCKVEVQLEKAVKLPVKFRLGSVDYVDYLEGKRRSY